MEYSGRESRNGLLHKWLNGELRCLGSAWVHDGMDIGMNVGRNARVSHSWEWEEWKGLLRYASMHVAEYVWKCRVGFFGIADDIPGPLNERPSKGSTWTTLHSHSISNTDFSPTHPALSCIFQQITPCIYSEPIYIHTYTYIYFTLRPVSIPLYYYSIEYACRDIYIDMA